MYRSSEEHVFQQIERIRKRAVQLLHGESGAAPDDEKAGDQVNLEALAEASGIELRLPRLAALFGLSPLESSAIVCLLAAEFDPFLRTLMRAVQREYGRPWLELGTIVDLLELPLARVPQLIASFTAEGALRKWAIALCDDTTGRETPASLTRVKLAARVARYLIGDDTLEEGLARVAPSVLLADSLVPAPAAEAMVERTRRALTEGEPLFVEITGAPGTGKRRFAEGLAAELGFSLLFVDLSRIDAALLEERLAEARRDARLTDSVLCLTHLGAHLPSGSTASEEAQSTPAPRRLPIAFARFLKTNEELVLCTAEEREPLFGRHASATAHIQVPFPSPSQRAQLLLDALKRRGFQPAEDVDLAAVTRRFALDPARIEIAARATVELARERDPADRAILRSELTEACRHQLRHDLKSLAERVTNSHRWEDLVIPVDVYHALREMVMYIRHAEHVYDRWGFAARHSLPQGVSALFAGPPGTGKTMCASVMARELDMELFRVDLSRVVSKWIGETEKNLGKVFDEAQRSNAIILFDEADALFAKRTEVKSSVDRYANLEINFLLQRMEAFSGVTILTTNFEDTLDTAFKRRLTFRMRFEKPDAEARSALWKKVFPTTASLADNLDLDRLGALYELSGGNIRNAAVRAAFMAAAEDRSIDMQTCMLAAEREAREMGVLIRSAIDTPPAEESSAPEALSESNGDAAQVEPGQPKTTPRLVPITHPRDQS